MAGEQPTKKFKANIKDTQHDNRLVYTLQTFNIQNNFVDLCFVCARGHKVYAHKLMLVTVSAQLKQILLEVPDNAQMITVHVPDIDSRLLGLLFDFLYEGSVRVNKHEYEDFQDLMIMLGIKLTNNETASQPPIQPTPQPGPSQQQVQPQLVYVPTAPNSQGQVQYVLATQAPLAQGQQQLMQQQLMTPVVQQPSSQPMMINQPSGQMVQAGTQMVTTQVPLQQSNMVPMVQQNGTQGVPQMVQCSSQMVIQGGQQAMMNNNQMQVAQNNYSVAQNNYSVAQSRPQYVMSSTTNNQMTTSSPSVRQYVNTPLRGGGRVRTRTQAQPQPQPQPTRQPDNVRGRRVMRNPMPITQNRPRMAANQLVQRSRQLTQ